MLVDAVAHAAIHHHHDLITTFQAVVMGALQGVTELFPISSLGHSVLFPTLFRWHNIVVWQSEHNSPWTAFLVMLHVGSAIGLLIYFWRDWAQIVAAFFRTLSKRAIETPNERLAWLIICATIPVGVIALILQTPLQDALSKPLAAAIFLIVNGCILLFAERYRRRAEVLELAEREGLNRKGSRRLSTLEFREAAAIGVGESTALIAGISRDGMCMTAGLGRGLDNADAARFAFLLATPPILLAGLYKFSDLTGPQGEGVRGAAVIAAIVAAVVAVFTVHFLTQYFKTRTLRPFGYYCLAFGAFMVGFTLIAGAP
ncbi:MAG TPA: undecaprenyl-diphosphate phosphatase [Solirubrobacteraceae bacterium]|nr:undecaprenyl-diphosphate phosphatase [Solirubrobacteraceae bacterium]